MEVYEPQEDSFLLEKYVKKFAKGLVLDMGTGSGIQAIAASKVADFVIATDINQNALTHCNFHIKSDKILTLNSDLFSFFEKKYINVDKGIFKGFNDHIKNNKFDTIIFNAPYLPSDNKDSDISLDGGKHGYEIIERFLIDVGNYLKYDGIILLVYSSRSKPEKIPELINKNLFDFQIIDSHKEFMEKIFVAKLVKSEIRKKIDSKVDKLKFLAKGARGFVFSGVYNNKKCAVKIKNPKSEVNRIKFEGDFLNKVNVNKIGPELYFHNSDFLIMEYIDGDHLIKYMKKNNIKNIVENLEKQVKLLDTMGIEKQEMMRPYKNVLIRNNKPVLIDFERCKFSENPKNLRQFEEFKKKIQVLNS